MFARSLAAALLCAAPALAEITVADAYARSAGPLARAGAVYMELRNGGETDDRLIAVTSEAAERAELHTHVEASGVMRMLPLEDGLTIPAGGSHALKRGGDHVMLMGLTAPWKDGDSVTLVLDFEAAGEVTVEVIVDQKRRPED